jgi:amidase
MADLHNLSALDQAVAVRAREVSPVELVAHQLDRAERLGPALGAFITMTPERALDQARAAERRVLQGVDDLPSLFGVPTAIKDLTPTAGVRTTYGSLAFVDHVPERDAYSVSLLAGAGTISLGKTNTSEFGLCPYTDNDLAGPARTPWAPDRGAGGSSGGAAVAVAAGLVPFAHGNDSGGSLRIPASCCGVVGLKPSRGRISAGPDEPDSLGLKVQGPVARTVADAAAMLDALAVPMPGDPFWAPPLPPGETFLGHARSHPGRLHVARHAVPFSGVPVDPACLAAWEEASRLLAELGHEVTDIAAPFDQKTSEYFITVLAVESLAIDVDAASEALLRPVTRTWRELGRGVSGAEYAAAVSGLQLAARRSVEAAAEYDIVLTPTLAMVPQPVSFFTEEGEGEPAGNFRRQGRYSAFTVPYNLTGQPAISLPLHWTDDGLPVGVMLAARPAAEATLLAVSAQLEAAQPWAARHPPCW